MLDSWDSCQLSGLGLQQDHKRLPDGKCVHCRLTTAMQMGLQGWAKRLQAEPGERQHVKNHRGYCRKQHSSRDPSSSNDFCIIATGE